MYEVYNTLTANHIDVWSVKTDAFTIRKDHLKQRRFYSSMTISAGGDMRRVNI